jgi:4-cresol dehydrogenase (hydroxylating)
MATIYDTLAAVTGKEYVIDADADDAKPYHDLFGGVADNDTTFEAVVLPGGVEELQKVVRAAADQGYALWTMPNAAGNGAGLGAPGRPAVIIDQRRMNRILEVNAGSATALVEPGVSYRQLHEHLQKKGIPLWIDSDLNPDNSIAGSICARHYGYTPYGDHMLMQCGMEVVLGNGDLLRTGMGAVPDSDTWQLFKYNFGPYLDGLFTQSPLAVVSKVGLWLMSRPPVYRPFMITLPDDDALTQMLEALRPLKLNGTLANTVAVSSRAFETALHHRLDNILQGRPVHPTTLKTIIGLGEWNVFAALYGGPDNVDLTWDTLTGIFNHVEGAVIFQDKDRGDDIVWRTRRALMGGEAPASAGAGTLDGADGVSLTAAAPIEGEAAAGMNRIVKTVAADYHVQSLNEFAMPARTLLNQIHLIPGKGGRDDAVAAAREIINRLTREGYGIVDESLALRRVADAHYRGSALADLVGRLQSAVGS